MSISEAGTEAVKAIIRTGNVPKVYELFGAIPIEKYDPIECFDFLKIVLEYTVDIKASKDMLVIILTRWMRPLEVKSIEAVVSMIAGLVSIDRKCIKYILTTIPTITVGAILSDNIMSKNPDGPVFSLVCDRLLAATTNPESVVSGADTIPKSFWNVLLAKAEQNKRVDAIAYLRYKVAFVADLAKLPTWTSITDTEYALKNDVWKMDYWKEFKLPQVTSGMIQDLQRAFSTYVNPQMPATEDDPKAREIPEDVLAEVSQIALTTGSLVDEYMKNTNMPDPDRLFGPMNAMVDRECATGIKGGCRMLTCCCRNLDPDEDEHLDVDNPYAWFDKNCDDCLGKIRDASHCLRFPTEGGGWVGTFCSLECLENKPPRPITSYSRLLIDQMVAGIQRKGVMDRFKWKHRLSKRQEKEGKVEKKEGKAEKKREGKVESQVEEGKEGKIETKMEKVEGKAEKEVEKDERRSYISALPPMPSVSGSIHDVPPPPDIPVFIVSKPPPRKLLEDTIIEEAKDD